MIANNQNRFQGKLSEWTHRVRASRIHLIIACIAYTVLPRALKDLGINIHIGKVVEAVKGGV